MRYAAVACVIAGGLLMSGTGAVALADPTDPGGTSDTGTGDGGTGSQATGTAATTVPTATLSGTSSVFATAIAGPAPGPPVQSQSLPKSDLTDGLGLKSTQRLDPLSLSNLLSPQLPPLTSAPAQATQPAGNTSTQTTPSAAGPALPAGETVTTSPGNTQTQATPPPLISFTPFGSDGAATGPTITIHNPLRDLLNIDINAPILPQLLPPPIVQILTAMAKQIPLTDLVLTPLSDYILPALMSDIVIPMGSINGAAPALQGVHATELRGPAMWTLPASGPPPAEIALGGVDMPQAPAPSPPPLPSPGASDRGPQPIRTAPPPKDATPLSEPVAYRAGYSDYLRNAGMAQITSVALPGIAGILLVTIGGGFIGYRQARAGHVIRAQGIARFLR